METPTPIAGESMSQDLIKKMSGRFPLVDSLRADLTEMARERVRFQSGQTIISAGDDYEGMFLLEDGWVVRSRWLPGGGRQIVNIALPGDFLCFNSVMFAKSGFDLIARTSGSMVRLRTPSVAEMMEKYPGVTAALMWASSHEESLLAERVVSLGRRDALGRLAHVICEIASRLEALERHSGDILTIPLIQEDFADILGLSSIHVTRTFRRLSELGAIEYRSGRLHLKQMDVLRSIAGFDDNYLHFSGPKDLSQATQL